MLARLIGLQLQLLDKPLLYLNDSSPLELDNTAPPVLAFLASHSNFREAFIVAEAYSLSDSSLWVGPFCQQVRPFGCI
jgi:hypothetical protein